MTIKTTYILILSLVCTRPLFGQVQEASSLQERITALCKDFRGKVGVAVEGKDVSIAINGAEHFPIMSLVKVPVAVAALRVHEQQSNESAYDTRCFISAKWLKADTYSPLRDKTGQRDTTLTLAEVVRYAVGLSDNNMCDWLIDYAGGMRRVNRQWRKQLKVRDLRLTETEEAMNKDIEKSRNNWATPQSVIRMLQVIVGDEKCLSAKNRALLRHVMESSPTGASKLKAGLPEHMLFAHKTGLSGRRTDGTLIASTDAGIITLPDGTDCYVAVLVKETTETNEAIDKLMADISRLVWDHATAQIPDNDEDVLITETEIMYKDQNEARQDISPTTLIVSYATPEGKANLEKALKDKKFEVIYDYKIIKGMAVKKPATMTLEEAKAYLEKTEGVTSVVYDHIMQLH